MKVKYHVQCLAIGAVAIYLAGCGAGGPAAQSQAPQQTVSRQSQEESKGTKETGAASETAAETEKPLEGRGEPSKPESGQGGEPSADRYEEITDRSQDEGKLVIYFLDLEVGPDAKDKSGDASILISPDGKVMLLDAGHPDSSEIVVKALTDLGIEKIDYLVASHPHIDHIGGIPAVVSRFPVGAAYQTDVEYTTQTYHNYVNALKEGGIDMVSLKTGDEFSFGEEVNVKVLGPDKEFEYPSGYPDNSTQFLNNMSLVLKFTYGESTALFCGDLYVSQERDYLDRYGDELKADVAKANHHGKDTSNLKKWIKTVSPKIVAAMGDEMGSMAVYDNYVKQGAEYHHTLYDGVIKVTVDGQGSCQAIDQKDSWLH